MAAPAPAVPLAFQNSAIHANTLFTYQPDAFQSLDLSPGSQWKQLPMGIAVNGSQSVVAQSMGQDVLFVLGGRTNSSELSFPGIQKYNFASNNWQEMAPSVSVVQNRVQHGVAYLQATKSILVYGGSQDNSYAPTSQTYTIGVDEPYTMKSYPAGAPTVQNPILLNYNASHALLAGGGENQDEIWTFSEAEGWVRMAVTIPGGVGDAAKVQGAILNNGNGTKQLELFDLSVSPNKIHKIDLENKFMKRDAIVARDDGPSQAPMTIRNGFSLAQSGNLVVLSGGAQDKSAGPLAIFDQSAGWKDNQAVFGSSANTAAGSGSGNGNVPATNQNQIANTPDSGSPAATASDAPANSAGPAAAASSDVASGPASAPTPGASVAQSAPADQPSSAAPPPPVVPGTSTDAAATSPAAATDSAAASGSTGASGIMNAAGASSPTGTNGAAAAGGPTAAPTAVPNQNSTAIIVGAVLGSFFGLALIALIAFLCFRRSRNQAQQEQEHQQDMEQRRAESPLSNMGSLNRTRSPFQGGQTPMISKPMLQPQSQAEDLAPPRRLNNDEGWNNYFTNNGTVENLYPSNGAGNNAGAIVAGAALGAGAGLGLAAVAGHRDTTYTEYTMDSHRSSANGHESALIVPPLNTMHARQPSTGTIPEDDPTYLASASSEGQDSWDPTLDSPSILPRPARPASSIYYDHNRTSSIYPAGTPVAANFPPVPALPDLNSHPYMTQDKGMRSIISKDFGTSSVDFAFPQSPVRHAGPDAEPRSAGNATGRKEGNDLTWVAFSN